MRLSAKKIIQNARGLDSVDEGTLGDFRLKPPIDGDTTLAQLMGAHADGIIIFFPKKDILTAEATFAIAVAVFRSLSGNQTIERCATEATTKGAAAALSVCPMCTGMSLARCSS